MNLRQRINYWRAWLYSRYHAGTFRPTCSTCPNWIRQGTIEHSRSEPGANGSMLLIPVTDPVGVCGRDQAKIFNDFETGYALKAWTGGDVCSRHPLFDKRPVGTFGLEHDPENPHYANTGGFSRLPSFTEALKMAGNKGQISYDLVAAFKDAEPTATAAKTPANPSDSATGPATDK